MRSFWARLSLYIQGEELVHQGNAEFSIDLPSYDKQNFFVIVPTFYASTTSYLAQNLLNTDLLKKKCTNGRSFSGCHNYIIRTAVPKSLRPPRESVCIRYFDWFHKLLKELHLQYCFKTFMPDSAP